MKSSARRPAECISVENSMNPLHTPRSRPMERGATPPPSFSNSYTKRSLNPIAHSHRSNHRPHKSFMDSFDTSESRDSSMDPSRNTYLHKQSSSSFTKKRKRSDIVESWIHFFPPLLEKFKQKLPPWQTGEKTYSKSPTIMLHEEILEFVKFIEPTEEEHVQRNCIIASIEAALKKEFYNAHIISFGSFETLFYLPQSDIDISLCVDDSSEVPRPRLHRILSTIFRVLQRSGEFIKIETVKSAKVPIVKAVHKQLGISVDISVNRREGLETVEIVKSYILKHPALRPLTFILKMFFFCRELNEVFTGGISSYTLITMVYSFLELHPLLLNGEIKEEENLGILLIEWLELFSRCFLPLNTVVTTTGFLNKSNEMIRNLKLNPNFLSVRDPVNKENDLSRGSKCTNEIRKAIEWGYDILTHSILTSHSNPSLRFPTYLGLILYVDDSLLRKRKSLLNQSKEKDLHLKNLIHSRSL